MSDNISILQRYAGDRRADAAESLAAGEEADDLGAFGFLRGIHDRAVMLELRKKGGNVKAVGYAWLTVAEYDPSAGITLLFAGQKIRIVGVNLNAETRSGMKFFNGLVRHRVTFIQEADEHALMKARDGETLVERIEW